MLAMCRLETLPDDQLLGAFEQLLRSKGSAAPDLALPLPPASQPVTQQSPQQPQPQPQPPSWPPWGAKQSTGTDGQPKGAAPQQSTAGSPPGAQSTQPGAAGQTPPPAASPQAAAPAAEAPPNLLQRLFGGFRRVSPGRSPQPPPATPAPSAQGQPAATAAAKQGVDAGTNPAAGSTPSKTGPEAQPAAAAPAAMPASGGPAAASEPKAPVEDVDRTAALFAAAGMPMPQQPGAAGAQQPAAQQPGGKPTDVAQAGAATTRELHASSSICSSMPGTLSRVWKMLVPILPWVSSLHHSLAAPHARSCVALIHPSCCFSCSCRHWQLAGGLGAGGEAAGRVCRRSSGGGPAARCAGGHQVWDLDEMPRSSTA